MIDLHIHTNVSDGQFSPAETVRLAKEKGANYISITDHDRISGLEEAECKAYEIGIGFIPGIEISVLGNRELHILGYYVDYSSPKLINECDNFLKLREQRGSRIYEFLSAKGVPLKEEQVQRHVQKGIAGRPHFARAMVEAGYVTSVQDAFDRYLGTPEFDKVERTKPSAIEGIRMIQDAGGIPVLAHPAMLKLNDDELEALVANLVADGLAGIECYYSTHTPEQTKQYLKLAEKYRLLITCGSDFHGENNKPGIHIGSGTECLSRKDTDDIINILRLVKEKRKGEMK